MSIISATESGDAVITVRVVPGGAAEEYLRSLPPSTGANPGQGEPWADRIGEGMYRISRAAWRRARGLG